MPHEPKGSSRKFLKDKTASLCSWRKEGLVKASIAFDLPVQPRFGDDLSIVGTSYCRRCYGNQRLSLFGNRSFHPHNFISKQMQSRDSSFLHTTLQSRHRQRTKYGSLVLLFVLLCPVFLQKIHPKSPQKNLKTPLKLHTHSPPLLIHHLVTRSLPSGNISDLSSTEPLTSFGNDPIDSRTSFIHRLFS